MADSLFTADGFFSTLVPMKIFWIFMLVTVGVLTLEREVYAKRMAPTEIAAVDVGDSVIVSKFEHLNGNAYAVFLIARSKSDNSTLWKSKLYAGRYNPDVEMDVQDICLKSLIVRGKTLVAEDEEGQVYEVEAATGTLLKPSAPVDYPPFKG